MVDMTISVIWTITSQGRKMALPRLWEISLLE